MLPRAAGKKLAAELQADNHVDLESVPAERIEDDEYRKIHQATRTGVPFFDAERAREMTRDIGYPRYFLDFETINPAVPLWPGIRPYQPLPFQWSCHIEQSPGKVEHVEFLDDFTGNPPFQDCASKLLATLGTSGSIIAYSKSVEMGAIKALAAQCPEREPQLTQLLARFVDLLPIARQTYYHRDMLGSWSIKDVIPTIDPGISYKSLDGVAEGIGAQIAYLKCLDPGIPDSDRERIREDLLRYCKQDTWAMVVLTRFLATGSASTL